MLVDFLHDHPLLGTVIPALSLIMFLGSLIAIPWMIVRMNADYFLEAPTERRQHSRHPLLGYIGIFAKNILGIGLLLAGIGMLVLPGQGLLTILIALSLLDFPGKRRFELALIERKRIHRAMNGLRRRFNRPPLLLPRKDDEEC